MHLFNFHHHTSYPWGIYNLELGAAPPARPFSIGLHPMNQYANWKDAFNEVQILSKNPHCIAIGECGLDRRSEVSTLVQEEVFSQHIQLAGSLKKPVVIHCVGMHALLLKYQKQSAVPLIVHGFNNKAQTGKMLLDAGLYISFGSNLLSSVSLQSFAREVPMERMFLETDDSSTPIQSLYEILGTIKNQSIAAVQNQMLKNLQTITNL